MADTKIIVLEMSFLKIYENRPLFHGAYEKMYNLGFRFRSSLAQMLHPITEEIVQTDAVFMRKN